MKEGLTSKQFVMVTLIIMLCGIAIFGRDYVQTKKARVNEQMVLQLSEEETPEYLEEETEESSDLDSGSSSLDVANNGSSSIDVNNNTNNQNTTSNSSNNSSSRNTTSGDTSGKVKKKKTKSSNYVGQLNIPKIRLKRGFVESKTGLSNMDKCVDYNICSFKGRESYPDKNNSHLILGAHNGQRWNAFFNRIEQLEEGDNAYIDYNGVRYKYKVVEKYEDAKGDKKISFHINDANKQMSLFTCASHGNYNRWYTVINFELVSETKL